VTGLWEPVANFSPIIATNRRLRHCKADLDGCSRSSFDFHTVGFGHSRSFRRVTPPWRSRRLIEIVVVYPCVCDAVLTEQGDASGLPRSVPEGLGTRAIIRGALNSKKQFIVIPTLDVRFPRHFNESLAPGSDNLGDWNRLTWHISQFSLSLPARRWGCAT
jgi:hypothetical protein